MAEWSRTVSWRQGHLLPDEALNALDLRSVFGSTAIAIVISHSCDLAQNPAKEPNVEIIIGRSISECDGNYLNAKNSRTLHIGIADKLYIELIARNKNLIPKETLVNFEPQMDLTFTENEKTVFQSWLAARYRRSEFSDDFQAQMSETGLDSKIKSLMRKPAHGKAIRAILFSLKDDFPRNAEKEPYLLGIVLLYDTTRGFREAEETASLVKEEIISFTLKKPTIVIQEIDCFSDGSFTVAQMDLYKKWNLDEISLADPTQPILAADSC